MDNSNKKLPKFADVVKASVEFSKLTNAQSEVYTIAYKLDDLQERIVSNATYLSENFARFATDCANGRIYSSTPCSSSSIQDIVADSARFESMKEMFMSLFRVVVGVKFFDAVKAMEEKSSAEVSS